MNRWPGARGGGGAGRQETEAGGSPSRLLLLLVIHEVRELSEHLQAAAGVYAALLADEVFQAVKPGGVHLVVGQVHLEIVLLLRGLRAGRAPPRPP